MGQVTSHTQALSGAQVEVLREILNDQGFTFVERPHTIYAASRGKLNISVYAKGPKVLIQGKDTEDFVRFVLEPEVLKEIVLGYEEERFPEMFEPHFGIDESGKGDFFGPLVIAGVYAEGGIARALLDAGITDSKKIGSDSRIRKLAEAIRKVPGIKWDCVSINPERYNELYEKFSNLNRLLAWGHATVISNLSKAVPGCPRALSDQFANPRELEVALARKSVGIELEQRTKAESDMAVAAASILARERFIEWLEKAGETYEIPLPRGAGEEVQVLAELMARDRGAGILYKLGKTHFHFAASLIG